MLRTERIDTDKVYDKVEKDLAKEIETTQACASLLASTRDQVVEQIRKNRSARYYLEKVSFITWLEFDFSSRTTKTNQRLTTWMVKRQH